jgi:hypothetical protein
MERIPFALWMKIGPMPKCGKTNNSANSGVENAWIGGFGDFEPQTDVVGFFRVC